MVTIIIIILVATAKNKMHDVASYVQISQWKGTVGLSGSSADSHL